MESSHPVKIISHWNFLLHWILFTSGPCSWVSKKKSSFVTIGLDSAVHSGVKSWICFLFFPFSFLAPKGCYDYFQFVGLSDLVPRRLPKLKMRYFGWRVVWLEGTLKWCHAPSCWGVSLSDSTLAVIAIEMTENNFDRTSDFSWCIVICSCGFQHFNGHSF